MALGYQLPNVQQANSPLNRIDPRLASVNPLGQVAGMQQQASQEDDPMKRALMASQLGQQVRGNEANEKARMKAMEEAAYQKYLQQYMPQGQPQTQGGWGQ